MCPDPVGLLTDLISPTSGSVGLGFALPSSSARFVVDEDAPLQVNKPDLVIPRNLGLSLSAISGASKANMGLEDGSAGVLITNVLPNSDPSGRGLPSGDIILRVWDQPVDSPEAVQSMIDAARAENRNFVVMLVLTKGQTVPAPRWVALQLETRLAVRQR